MEQKSEVKLNELPRSDSDYWKDAEIENITLPVTGKCLHEFEYVSARGAECKKCRAGYILTPNEKVIKGHIFHKDLLIV